MNKEILKNIPYNEKDKSMQGKYIACYMDSAEIEEIKKLAYSKGYSVGKFCTLILKKALLEN